MTVEQAVEKFGKENVKVMCGELHVRGQMPNSIEYGWYLLCYIDD